ncbi:MAG TPA: cytochrome C biogenesis protein CcdA [Rhodobacteraceae bacterium]|jgi:cytochrome c-type biogenesis protein|nr:cytochrome C biogenesis protein CcdA [Paracoccaceae bacterium]
MEPILAYFAGLLTLINPCVLPVLPIVLAGALQAGRAGPLYLAAGMAVSFIGLGFTVASFGFALGIDEDTVARAGAVLMVIFGAVLLVPQASARFSTVTSGFAARIDVEASRVDGAHLRGQFLGGLLLGAVWSPCIGPTLGAAISLAAQGESLGWVFLIMTAFAAGVATLILGLGYGARGVIGRNKARMQRLAEISRPLMGIIFIAVGSALLFRLHHIAEAWLIEALPAWLITLSVSL